MNAVRELKRTFVLERRHGTWRLRRMFGTEAITESSDRTTALECAFERLRSAAPCRLSLDDESPARWELSAAAEEWKPISRT